MLRLVWLVPVALVATLAAAGISATGSWQRLSGAPIAPTTTQLIVRGGHKLPSLHASGERLFGDGAVYRSLPG